jgi:tetratricopeptide (TPR) repeat protein
VVGYDARRNGTPLIVEEAVGAAGYLAGPRTHVLDYYALGDPLLSRSPSVVNDTEYGRWMLQMVGDLDPQGWRIGHHKRNVPNGYLATIMTGENRIQDRLLAAFYDHLRLVTQGPLWSIRRCAAAIELSFGRWNELVPRTRPEFDVPIDWMEVLAVDPNLPEPLFRLGEDLAEAGDLDAARRRLEEVIRLDPRHARALLLMGRICRQAGDTQGANAYFDRVRALVPGLAGTGQPGSEK